VDELAAQGVLHEETARILRTPAGTPFYLYQHQTEALENACNGESYVVTSGTGSAKSLTYFLPIVDTLLRETDGGSQSPFALRSCSLSHERTGELAVPGVTELKRKLCALDEFSQ
jgi:superfamily II DNA/RNA helicase